MRTVAQAAVIAVVGIAAFTIGARNGALGAVKVLERRARQLAAQRAAMAADIASDGE